MELNYGLVGVRIRAARLRKCYTQERVSEYADISPQHYSKIESGGTRLSLPCLVRICNALEVTPDELLMDSVNRATPQMISSVASVFSDCSNDEMFLMLSIAENLKKSIRQKGLSFQYS
ncbi:MAG: helix-turn-helix transcriptional regulator [Oscillospiraceae bacterium]|nr:helix-turn-helix transcriptional regulator [Oscillospiraceae bacterium]